VPDTEKRRLLSAFLTAARTGDLDALEALFAEDIVSYSDGGGLARASRVPVVGRDRVARYVRAFAPRFWPGVEATPVEANGQPALLLRRDGAAFALLAVTAGPEGIEQLLWMMNPTKLGRLAGSGPRRRPTCHEWPACRVLPGDSARRRRTCDEYS